ncbi:uncharacterized protein METZ01_LOCUS289451, partial [marine metagenome]
MSVLEAHEAMIAKSWGICLEFVCGLLSETEKMRGELYDAVRQRDYAFVFNERVRVSVPDNSRPVALHTSHHCNHGFAFKDYVFLNKALKLINHFPDNLPFGFSIKFLKGGFYVIKAEDH